MNNILSINNETVAMLVKDALGQAVVKISKMTTGLCNEVYLISLNDRSEVVLRLNKEKKYLYGSHKNIPLFKSKGISVPEIIFEDYSLKKIPYYYQILKKIDGKDIGQVFFELSEGEIIEIGKEISDIIKKLKKLPTNGKFGDTAEGEDNMSESCLDAIYKMVDEIHKRNNETGVIDNDILEKLNAVVKKYASYFESVKSVFYYDDMCSKNVMVHNGKFTGIVDLDSVAYGDNLEAIGRIKASWHNTEKGDLYLNTIIRELNLDDKEIEMISVYAFINSVYWASEHGIQFNSNTSTKINPKEVEKNNRNIKMLFKEI